MTKKERCKEILAKLFGPASTIIVDDMTEEDCVERCKIKVTAFLGQEQAREFDSIGEK